MATFDYSEMYNVANELLTEFGGSLTLTRSSTDLWIKKYDPTTETIYWENTDTGVISDSPQDSSYTGIGVISDYTQEEKRNENIQQTDQRIYAQVNTKPTTDDLIIMGSVTYKCVTATEINPSGGYVVLYDIQVRK